MVCREEKTDLNGLKKLEWSTAGKQHAGGTVSACVQARTDVQRERSPPSLPTELIQLCGSFSQALGRVDKPLAL